MTLPAWAPAAIGAAGDVLSGLIGRRKPDPAFASAVAMQQSLQHERASFNQKMALAKQHGLHPLSVLGVPTSTYSPTITFGGDPGPDYAALGAGASQLASAFVEPPAKEPPKMPVPEDPITYRQRMANMRRLEAEAGLAELRLSQAAVTGPGAPPGVRTSNDVTAMQQTVAEQSGIPLSLIGGAGRDGPITIKQEVAPPHPKLPGFAAAVDQGWGRVRDRDGSNVPLVRQEAVQADIEKGATFQALAKAFGIERAMQITAVLENEHLLMGAALGTGLLMRTPAARLGKWAWDAGAKLFRSGPKRDALGRFTK